MIRVFLVDDDPEVRAGIESVIERHEAGLTVVASVGTVNAALEVIESDAAIDVSIVDLGLPDGHGNALIARVVATRPDSAVLVFTVFGDDESIFSALRAGADGYLLKDASSEEVLEAARHAWTGGAPMTPEVARKVVQSFRPDAADPTLAITEREREVLELMSAGSTYSEIGDMLQISPGTVHSHAKNIYRKLDVTSKTEAVKIAIQQRLFD